MTQPSLEEILQEKFGLAEFRKGQRDIIASVLAGRDSMAVMPTGGGKSLCYQLPAVAKPGCVVVISPLIALMNDQVRTLKKLGIPAGCLHSGHTWEEKRDTFRELRQSKHFVLYLSPERANKEGFAEWVKTQNISLFAVDESHCISQWGPDFRPDYHQLKNLRDLRPDVPILALTATATPPVLKDIIRQLQLNEPDRHIHGFYRPNLYYQVETCENEAHKMSVVQAAILQNATGRVLIYCGTRKQSEALVAELSPHFPDMGFYHAGLSTEERTRIQKEYETGKIRVLAATNAFGMGIDHPDVRLVMHFQMPANIESYYQEIGRAGRDGKPSTCTMLYTKRDKGLHSYFIQQSQAEAQEIKRRWRALDTIVQFSEGGECRHAGILTYFKDSQRIKACGHCDVCAPDSPRRVSAELPEAPSAGARKRFKTKSKARSAHSERPLTPAEEVRAEVLRTWRKDYAEQNGIPAFLVFSNKTLEALAMKNPSSFTELENVYGMGPHKVEHLGALILAELASAS